MPTPGATGITVSYSHLVEMDAVGRTHVIPEGQTDEFSIRQLLDGIENPLDRLTTGRDISAARDPGAGSPAGALQAYRWSPRQTYVLVSVLGVVLVGVVYVALVSSHVDNITASVVIAITSLVVLAMALVVLMATGVLSESSFVSLFSRIVKGVQRNDREP